MYSCEQCARYYIYKENLSRHIKELHSLVKTELKCTICSKTYGSKKIFVFTYEKKDERYPANNVIQKKT